MAEYLQAPPRRKALGLLADALTSGQEALNTVNLPYLGGLGGLLLGQAPEYLQDVSYGMPAFRGGNVATGGLGTLTPDTRMLDVATLPFVGAGAAKAGQVGAKTLGKEVARQVETGTGLLGSNVLDPRQYATAYHGSPYNFDKFDINKLGSGEGAQAYGHGMYFAENPAVAKDYAKKLAVEKTSMSQIASDYLQKDVPPSAIKMLHEVATSSIPVNEAARNARYGSIALRDVDRDVLKNIVSDFRNKATGNIYKVDIPDESVPKMLNWDIPISKQSPEVLKSLKIPTEPVQRYNQITDKLDELQFTKGGLDSPEWKKLTEEANTIRNKYGLGRTGEELYTEAARLAYANKNNNPSKIAAESLLQQGITGIRYFDQGSRSAGGTQNYVVFDPKEVRILEKGLLK
jgi:hypothetical protein